MGPGPLKRLSMGRLFFFPNFFDDWQWENVPGALASAKLIYETIQIFPGSV
jgi:hypothetical protein